MYYGGAHTQALSLNNSSIEAFQNPLDLINTTKTQKLANVNININQTNSSKPIMGLNHINLQNSRMNNNDNPLMNPNLYSQANPNPSMIPINITSMNNMNGIGNMNNIGNMGNMNNMGNISILNNMNNMNNMSNINNMSNMNMNNIGNTNNMINMGNMNNMNNMNNMVNMNNSNINLNMNNSNMNFNLVNQQQAIQQQILQQQMVKSNMMAQQMLQNQMMIQQLSQQLSQQQNISQKIKQQSNIMNSNVDQNNNILDIIFHTQKDNEIESLIITTQIQENEKVSKLIEKYRQKSEDYSETKKFIFNATELNPRLTCKESLLTDGSVIKVIDIKNVKGAS